jgi:hypothetical protein
MHMATPQLSATAAGVCVLLLFGYACARAPAPELPALPEASSAQVISYRKDVEPVLERRCVVCHGCYDAPCQLLASSYEGIERGATQRAVYDSSRLRQADPTRLGLDAQSVEAWRALGFDSVLEGEGGTSVQSLLLSMLAFGRSHAFAADEKLPEDLPLNVGRSLSCPTAETFDDYARKNPMGGMPYGTAPLSDDELRVLASWVMRGAPAPEPEPPLPARAVEQVQRWEALLNGDSLKQRIAARYLYEHWVFAHLHFENTPGAPFFAIFRSTTPPGEPIEKIASRRPYDDPGVDRFWYRLEPIRNTIVHKDHIAYPLSDAKLERVAQLFFDSEWEPTRFPEYGAEASNPFVSFDQIPARSRYQFLLDDSRFFVMTFIRGPVCRGQVAVDAIQDHFFVAFLDPDRDPSVTDPRYLERTKEFLNLPAEHAGHLTLTGLWAQYAIEQKKYLNAREDYYDEIDPDRVGPALDWVWNGADHDRGAMLTVFRHFDNANVRYGWIGQTPKTAWIMDFPTFERLYYALVADFDVFGNVTHQVSTRFYMDFLRMQSETLYLAFLPPERRKPIRDFWYKGATQDHTFNVDHIRTLSHGTQIAFESADPHPEFIEMLLEYNAAVAGPADLLNRCRGDACDRPGASSVERRAEDALRPLTRQRGGFIIELPEVSFVRVRSGGSERDAVYTLVHNRAHTNVAAMFREDARLEPADDTLTLIDGYTGSYPNFAFDLPVAQIEEFASALEAVKSPAEFTGLVDRWGVRRSSARFWQTFDWFNEDFHRREPVEAGILDLNRYHNL